MSEQIGSYLSYLRWISIKKTTTNDLLECTNFTAERNGLNVNITAIKWLRLYYAVDVHSNATLYILDLTKTYVSLM